MILAWTSLPNKGNINMQLQTLETFVFVLKCITHYAMVYLHIIVVIAIIIELHGS